MLIKSVLQSAEFESLRNQYVSFVQVGGAYGYNYRSIIDFLRIKSVIITDLDYDKDVLTESEILSSCSTNSTINQFAASIISDPCPTVQTLYEWKQRSNPIVINETICLAFQGREDGFARTLEEAMLAKRYGITAVEKKNALSIPKTEFSFKHSLAFVTPGLSKYSTYNAYYGSLQCTKCHYEKIPYAYFSMDRLCALCVCCVIYDNRRNSCD